MTPLGIIHLLSAIYLSAVLCLAISLNEHRQLGQILRQTLRRWAQFLGLGLLLALVITLLS